MRHNITERLGVLETDLIVTKQLGWIFREQPIIDVGLDAIIEQSEEGTPTGKFLAVQIKSGASNFHISGKKIIHYVSHIHYNYWLNLGIPIILIAHFPDSEKTYWQHITSRNFKKTKKRWKIEIPLNQEFKESSKIELSKILYDSPKKSFVFELYRGKIEKDNIFDFAENTECIADAKDSVLQIVEIINDLRNRTNLFNSKLDKYIESGLSDKDPQVKASIKGFGKDLNIISKRLENEIDVFSSLYSVGFYAFEQVALIYYMITDEPQDLYSVLNSIEKIPESVDEALEGISVMRNGVSNLPKKFAVLKEAKILLLEIIDLLIAEFSESKDMAKKIMDKIKSEI